MENYSNSLNDRKAVDSMTGFPDIPKKEDEAPKEKTEPIVATPAIVKKKSGLRRFKDDFIESEVRDVKESIFMDIIMPAIKNTIADGISTFVDMMLFGESGKSRGAHAKNGRIISYNSMYESNPRNKIQTSRSSSRVRVGQIDDVILGSRVDAEKIVRYLQDYIDQYGLVPVSELYDAVGYDTSWTDHSYGWDDISGYSISRVREGFLLELPNPKPLK